MKHGLITLITCTAVAISLPVVAQIDDTQLLSLQSGEQLALSQVTASKRFAGHSVELSNFSGVFGMSSDTAYIMTACGEARLGDLMAKPGRVLILTPYGGTPVKQTYDAARFLAGWTPKNDDHSVNVMAGLEKVRKKQKRAMFWGLYQSTSFNVAAPGSSNTEMARRSIVGSKVIQNIRFSNEADPENIEYQIVSAFRDALVRGDVQAVASLMDPTPYGGSDLRGGADGARLLMAKRLIKSKNWSRLLQSGSIKHAPNSNFWTVSKGQIRINIQMRPIGDFTYISSIEQEA